MFEIMFQEKKLAFHFHIDDTLPGFVYGDENRLRQVLTNLLSNAMKYTPQGQVKFSAWLSRDNPLSSDNPPFGDSHVSREEDSGEVSPAFLRFDVQDTGIGIRDEDAGKLFKPFEQLDTRKNRNVVGTGLGLAICFRLCQLMGGDLRLKSEYGVGSVFSVAIPYISATEGVGDTAPGSLGEFSARGVKVLVVDDIEINLELTEAMLDSFDIKVDLAKSGEEALKLVQTNIYDVIFMDHMMPGMDGIETTRRIRELRGPCAAVPIIALTANVINGAESMFLENQFNGFLAKPIEFASLNLCLRKWLPPEKILNRE
jgi:CheY-like chemotaxis protein